MAKKMRIIALVLAILCCLPLVGCGSPSRAVKSNRIAKKVVATAGNVDILYEELYYLAMTEMSFQKEEHGEDYYESDEARAELTEFVNKNLLNSTHALISVGKDLGIDIEDSTIGDAVQSDMDSILADTFADDREAYIKSLADEYLTDHYIRTYHAVENYLAAEIINTLLREGDLDSSDETAKEIIESDRLIRTIQVFLDASDKANTAELAKSIRDGIAAKATPDARYDAMRDAISGVHNDDFSDLLGHGYYFFRGEMDESYETAAFALAEYDVSEVVTTERGYYIIMRMPKDTSYITDNFEDLKFKTYTIKLNEMVEERLSEMSLSFTKFGSALDYCNLKPVVPDGGEHTVMWIAIAGSALALGLTVWGVLSWRRKKGLSTPKKHATK